jgi:hypothetical protein
MRYLDEAFPEQPLLGASPKDKGLIAKLHPRALALFSNISAGVQYFGPLFALTNTALMLSWCRRVTA